MNGLWLAKAPLVLASKSTARQALLKAAGIPFDIIAAKIDERSVEAPLRAEGVPAMAIAAHLARSKALAVSAYAPSRLVVGADQVLALDGEIFTKPESREAARAQLATLSGRMHALQSAVCVTRDGTILFEAISTANMICRVLTLDFIDRYIAAAGDAVLRSVGVYQVEGLGVHLFDKLDGDQATILGLPLLPLLAFLREEGSLAA